LPILSGPSENEGSHDAFGGNFGDCGHYHGGGVGNPLSDAVFNEFYLIAFRKKMCIIHSTSCRPVDAWMCEYNEARASGPLVLDAIPMTKHKVIAT
jgi:hypothetical protein